MAAKNAREIELALSITTANEDALNKLQKDVKDLAKAGGDAAPAFDKLATELEQLTTQAKQVGAFEKLSAELEITAVTQRQVASASEALKQKLDAATVAANANKVAEQQKNAELESAKDRYFAAKTAIDELKNATEKADRGTSQYKVALRGLNTEMLTANVQKRALAKETTALAGATKASEAAVAVLSKEYNKAAQATEKAASETGALKTQLEGVKGAMTAAGVAGQTLAEAQQEVGASLSKIKAETLEVVNAQKRQAEVAAAAAAADKAHAQETLRLASIVAETKRRQEAQARAEAAGVLADYAKMEDANRRAAASAKDVADKAKDAATALSSAFGTVGTRSAQELRGEIDKVKAAMQTLAASGRVTGTELSTAMAKGNSTIKALERDIREVSGALTLADRAATTFKGALGQIAAGNLIADGVGFLVQKVKDLGVAFVKTTADTETLRRALNAVYKDTGLAEEQFDFLKKTANDAGVAVGGIQQSFVRFSAATQSANIPLQQSNDLFVAVTRVAGSLGLSADSAGGALDALGQMASKGTVSMEELRQQLGDRMPGALGAAAKGLGLTEAELIKLVESGNLAARDFFPAFTKGLTQMQGSTEGLVPTFNRLKNAVLLLAQNMGDSVFLQVFTQGLKALGVVAGGAGVLLSGLVEMLGLTGKALALMGPGLGSIKDRMALFSEEVEKARARQTTFTETLTSAVGGVGAAAAATASLATTTQAAAKVAADAGVSWEGLSRAQQASALAAQIATQRQGDTAAVIAGTVSAVEGLLKAQEKESTARDKSAKAAETQGRILVELAKLQGDEVEVLNASVKATELHAVALEKAAFSRAEEVRLLELQRTTIEENRKAQGLSTLAIEKEVAALTKKIETSKADAEQARAAADAAKGLVDASRLQRAAHDDNSKALAEYTAKVTALRATLTEYEVLQKNGLKTDAEATEVRKQLADATFRLRDIYNDVAAAVRGEAEAKISAMRISQMALGTEVELYTAKAKLARASGENEKAIRLEKAAREAKLAIDRLSLEIKEVELKLAAQELQTKLELLKLEEPLNALKRKSLELQVELNAAQQKSLGAGKELLDIRAREEKLTAAAAGSTRNLTNAHREASSAAGTHASAVNGLGKAYTDAGARALEAKGNFMAAALAQRNADVGANSITNKAPSASQGVWTQSAIVDYLKQSGLSETLAADLSKQFTKNNGSVDYAASPAQKKWGGQYGTLSEALGKMSEYYRFNDSGKFEAAQREQFLQGSAAPAKAAPTTPQASGATRTVNINLNGRTASINTDAQGAAALQDILKQLEGAAGRAR